MSTENISNEEKGKGVLADVIGSWENENLNTQQNQPLQQTDVVPSLPRTKADIEKEINRLINDDSNFISDNYGSEAADNGEYEVYFSKHSTEETLKRFAKWLLGNEV